MTWQKRLCLKGGAVWRGAGSKIQEGGLLIKGTDIEAVFTPADAEAAASGSDEVVDVGGKLLLPPLIDCHVHSNSTLLRGTENSLPLELWSYHAINYGRGSTDDGVRYAALLTDIEMIRNGIGGFIDHFPQTHRAAQAIDAHVQSGLRVGFAPFFADLWDEDILEIPLDRDVVQKIAPLAPKRPQEIRAAFERIALQISSGGEGRISLLAGPNAPQRCSEELWELWRDLQSDFDIGSHTHFLETLPQAKAASKRWPDGLTKALDDAGLLHGRLSLAHGIWIDDRDRERIAKAECTVSYNPLSNAMLGSGRKRVRDDIGAGVKIALGTDCSNTGGRHDLFEIMRNMLVSGRDPGSDFDTWIQPEEVLASATTTGAGALGNGRLTGMLEPGRRADVLVLDFATYGLATSPLTVSSLVSHADSRNVNSLMVDGRWLLKNGVITVFDEKAITAAARVHAEELRELARERMADVESLRPAYGAWQAGVFSAHRCPTCGQTNGPAPQTYACSPG